MTDSLYIINYETRAVLGMVTPRHGRPRTHAVGKTTGRVLCGGVRPEHLADRLATNVEALPTCPRCQAAFLKKIGR